MPSNSTSARLTRIKHCLAQMSELVSRIKELRMLAKKKRNAYRLVDLKLKYLQMCAGQSKRVKRKEKRRKPCARKRIQRIVQQMKTKLIQEQGKLSLQTSSQLRKKMKNLKQLAHKTPQSWKPLKDIISGLDLALSGLLPIELALTMASKQSGKPKEPTYGPIGPYRVPMLKEKASYNRRGNPDRRRSPDRWRSPDRRRSPHRRRSPDRRRSPHRRRSSSRKRRSSRRPRARPKKTEVKTDIPQGITTKGKLEREKISVSQSATTSDSKSFPEIETYRKAAKASLNQTDSQESKTSVTQPRNRPEFYFSCIKPSHSLYSNISDYTEIASYIRPIGFQKYSSTEDEKPFELSGRATKETKKGHKKSERKSANLMSCMTTNISKSMQDSSLDYSLHETQSNNSMHPSLRMINQDRRQERPDRLSSLKNEKCETLAEHKPLELNVAELRKRWERYFAEQEKSPMELWLEQRRNEKAALEVQRQLEEAERQRRLVEKQRYPWRSRRPIRMARNMYSMSELFSHSENHEVCPECGVSVCRSEDNVRPIAVTKEMINKFRYLRVG